MGDIADTEGMKREGVAAGLLIVVLLLAAVPVLAVGATGGKVVSEPAAKPRLVPAVQMVDPGPHPVVDDPGPNPTVPAADNPAYVPPMVPDAAMIDADPRVHDQAWRCIDELGYAFIYSGSVPLDGRCEAL